MDTLCVIPYKYIPHKSRRKEDGARSRVQIGTTCYGSHLKGGNDFSRALEIRQTTLNIHNLEDETQVRELAMDNTPKFPNLSDSAIHGRLTGNQARPIDLENEVNNSHNFISETTDVRAAVYGSDERSPVAPKSRGYDDGTDQEPASKEVSTFNSVGSPICSPHGFDVITFARSPPRQDGGDSTLAREPEISSRDGFNATEPQAPYISKRQLIDVSRLLTDATTPNSVYVPGNNQREPLIIEDDSNGESDDKAKVGVALSDLLASIKDQDARENGPSFDDHWHDWIS
ncbi:hypothetical protein VE02_08927 [Pseudogymnoascus sp. 03VT05]|nr:hypothetical protein VE02_08927 [Pseudogymnoascus sp. 03VT05]